MQNNIVMRRICNLFIQPASILCIFWLAGLAGGAFIATGLDETHLLLMRPTSSYGLSIIRQLATVFLPFLFAAYAVSIDKPKLLLVLCFIKAFAFSFCGFLIFRIYNTAGWLVRILMLFTDIFTVPVFYWYCLRHIDGQTLYSKKDLIICILLATFLACFDYLIISPFSAELIDYTMGRYAYSCWI